jgi:hypothetical protein
MGEVVHLWRFAVKGLDRDELRTVNLSPGLGFPNDRRWALQLEQLPPPSDDLETPPPTHFDPQCPTWIHKQCTSPVARNTLSWFTLLRQVLSVHLYCRRDSRFVRNYLRRRRRLLDCAPAKQR